MASANSNTNRNASNATIPARMHTQSAQFQQSVIASSATCLKCLKNKASSSTIIGFAFTKIDHQVLASKVRGTIAKSDSTLTNIHTHATDAGLDAERSILNAGKLSSHRKSHHY